MEKGDKPKTMTSAKAKVLSKGKQKKPAKEKKPAKQKQKQKQKQENVQIVKVNVNTSKEEKPALAKPVRKEITRQTTYVTLDKPYALQPEEEELLTITKHVPNPPRDKSRAKVTTLVSDPKNEIPQANIQEQPLQVPVPIKKKVTAKKKGLFDVPVEIYVGAKPVLSAAKETQSLLDEPEILKVKPQKKPRKLKEPKYDVPIEIFEPKKRTVGKTVIFGEGSVEIFNPKTLAKTTEEEQALLSVAEEVTTKKGKRQKPVVREAKSNSSSIDKSIQNSSINNNEKVQELVLAEPTVSEKKTGLIISPKKPKEAISSSFQDDPMYEQMLLIEQDPSYQEAIRKIEQEKTELEMQREKERVEKDKEAIKKVKEYMAQQRKKAEVEYEEYMAQQRKKAEAEYEEEVFDYITNTDDANISNPNSGETINIQNENELEEEFGLTSAQLESYKEDYSMTPKGSVEGLIETIEKKSPRGRPSKYASEEERKQAVKEQKKASALRKKTESKAITQIEQFMYPPDTLEDMFLKEKFIEADYPTFTLESEQAFAESVGQYSKETTIESLSSDFVSKNVDNLSDNNNFGTIQSAQEPQFEFE